MPSLGADMEAGTLVKWLVKPGDSVRRGDVVAVVETQKGAIEVEVFDAGTVDRLLVEPETKVPVGTPLALIRREGEGAPCEPSPSTPVQRAVASPPAGMVAPEAPAGRLRITPAARRLATERGIELPTVKGSGPGGTVQLVDIEALSPPPGRPGFDFAQMRIAIAAAMSRSKREIPHYYLSDTVDVNAASGWVSKRNDERPPGKRVLMGALFIKAVARAAQDFPEFNGAFQDGTFHPGAAVHVGMAIALRGGGLAAPAIHDTANLDTDTLMERMRDLVARVRAGRFRSSEVSDPTITVSSLGDRGVEALFGVIYPPQVAIVGFGKVVERPWVVDGVIEARSVTTVTLAADHRVSDGHRGGLFLARIGRLLQQPETL